MSWAQEFNISQGNRARPVHKTSQSSSYLPSLLLLSLPLFLLASILYSDEAAPSKVTEVLLAKVMAFLVFTPSWISVKCVAAQPPCGYSSGFSPSHSHPSHAGQPLHHWAMTSALFLFYISDRVSLSHSDRPWTHSAVQADLGFGLHLHQPPEQCGWQACNIMPSYIGICLVLDHFFFPFLLLSSSQPDTHHSILTFSE